MTLFSIMMDSNALNKSPRFTNGDSILAPGGSVSNMYALMIARHKLYPQVNLIFGLFVRSGDDAALGEVGLLLPLMLILEN